MSRFIIAVDQSTAASKVFLLDEQGEICHRFAKAHRQFYPQSGYVEHDAGEIWRNVLDGIHAVCEGVPKGDIAALALCNQRETTVLWDRGTGEPLCPAIVWQDVRGESLCREITAHADMIRERTGLALSPYYSAAKAACVLRENPAVQAAARENRLCIGTVDSYLVYRLTEGAVFATDCSNASRTQLMNLEKLCWDGEVCARFGIDPAWLPEIRHSDASFGEASGVPIAGVLGDSHASLFGQGCLDAGMAKLTYGTGSSVMMNAGDTPIHSRQGLSACVAFGYGGRVRYALEGNVTCSGDTLCWLRDEAEMIASVDEVEEIAASVPDTGGVYLVPAFSGLGAPHFDSEARAILCGVNRGTRRAHIVRAALESMAYQDAEIILAMMKDVPFGVRAIMADGGGSRNALLMQFQADLLGCPLRRAVASELSALGAGYMGGLAVGMYDTLENIPTRQAQGASYEPQIPAKERARRMDGWKRAVARCRWTE